MRVKQLWNYLPLPQKAKLFWERITFSRLTTFYFFFSVIHCIFQIIFQIQAFFVNKQAATFLWDIVLQGNATVEGFTVLGSDLRECKTVPETWSTASCEVLWNGTALDDNYGMRGGQPAVNAISTIIPAIDASTTVPVGTSSSAPSSTASSASSSVSSAASSSVSSPTAASSSSATASASGTKTVTVVIAPTSASAASEGAKTSTAAVSTTAAATNDAASTGTVDSILHGLGITKRMEYDLGQITALVDDGKTVVNISGLGYQNNQVQLDQACLHALNWPVMILSNTKREDVTFIAFQFWVLGMSIVAILNESIPHIIATLLTHMLATAWGGFQIEHTRNFRQQFDRLTSNGACKPIHLLPAYWEARGQAEIPSLALNAVALVVSAILSWRLVKLFGWQTFKRVGASLTINRIYKIVLSLSIVLQLSVFFVIASLGLWIDQLCNGYIATMAIKGDIYRALTIVVACLLPPWLILGWLSVRRELRIPMLIFLGLSIAYLTGWGLMFDSTTFRWTVKEWRFFAMILTASAGLVLISFILGIICRGNFGKGLPRYLNAQESLPEDFSPVTPGDAEASPMSEKGEKVDFPDTAGRPVPTFSATFGAGAEVPPPSEMRFGPRHMGPRFASAGSEPFEPQPYGSYGSTYSQGSLATSSADLSRKDSQRSVSSVSSDRSKRTVNGKPWIIE